jgi:hypothetical protein
VQTALQANIADVRDDVFTTLVLINNGNFNIIKNMEFAVVEEEQTEKAAAPGLEC